MEGKASPHIRSWLSTIVHSEIFFLILIEQLSKHKANEQMKYDKFPRVARNETQAVVSVG